MELSAVGPAYARELVSLLVEHRVLRAEEAAGGRVAAAAGGGVLAACFDRGQPGVMRPAVRCYFLGPEGLL